MKVLIGGNPMGLEKAIPSLQAKFPGVEFQFCEKRGDEGKYIVDADIFMGWLNRDVFLAAKKLKWIQSPSTGINYYLAIPELKEGDVLLTSAGGTHSGPLAESVMGMILAFTRGIRQSVFDQQKHIWRTREVRSTCIELTGTTMGIVGFGNLGRALAKRAAAFDMKIVAVDVYPNNKPDYVAELTGLEGLNNLLRTADYVVVTVPGTPQTHGMIGAAQISLMKPTAMLVGISRGGIIDEAAMAKALREGKLWAAASDVFHPEPLPADSELWDIPNLLVCAHIAGGTQFEGERVIEIFSENLERFLKGNLPLRNQADKEKGW